MSQSKWIIYTDGSEQPSIGAGGYAAVICYEGKCIKTLYQGFRNTSNNRMELKAVIEALKWFKDPTELMIVSDSQYVVNSINGKYCYKWIRENDLSKKNLDLWFELINLLDYHTVTFKWVKGHNNHSMNEYADQLAQHAAQCMNLPEDPINIKWNDCINKDKENRESSISLYRS